MGSSGSHFHRWENTEHYRAGKQQEGATVVMFSVSVRLQLRINQRMLVMLFVSVLSHTNPSVPLPKAPIHKVLPSLAHKACMAFSD